ncbi:4-hydroxythreonine-4-phosphate dehydrogenase [Actinomycetota bacterium]|nr:4-hydroxythreonine-4-phosphate dehydrogenase [Actinomycetota bacterium]
MTPHVLALTMGDPAGIGPEIVARTLAEAPAGQQARGIAVGDTIALRRAVSVSGLDVDVREIPSFDVAPRAGTIDIVDTGALGDRPVEWGVVDKRAGRAAVEAITVATAAAMKGEVAAIVTGPINKEAIWAAGATHLGHTEMLGELTGVTKQDTMFVVGGGEDGSGHDLKIFFTTRHLSLATAIQRLSTERILASIENSIEALVVFGLERPRFAVAALNPHGGENGAFGDEELTMIGPACDLARGLGHDVRGPIPADSVFHQGLQGRHDAVLSHFHDQGHIAAKTYDFNGTVSVTVGLPILRTSVDHGTAFDIAGRGTADAGTMRAAYLAAVRYAPRTAAIRAAYGA